MKVLHTLNPPTHTQACSHTHTHTTHTGTLPRVLYENYGMHVYKERTRDKYAESYI